MRTEREARMDGVNRYLHDPKFRAAVDSLTAALYTYVRHDGEGEGLRTHRTIKEALVKFYDMTARIVPAEPKGKE